MLKKARLLAGSQNYRCEKFVRENPYSWKEQLLTQDGAWKLSWYHLNFLKIIRLNHKKKKNRLYSPLFTQFVNPWNKQPKHEMYLKGWDFLIHSLSPVWSPAIFHQSFAAFRLLFLCLAGAATASVALQNSPLAVKTVQVSVENWKLLYLQSMYFQERIYYPPNEAWRCPFRGRSWASALELLDFDLGSANFWMTTGALFGGYNVDL